MADSSKLVPKILKWEGGFVNDPDDLGGATNKGITFAVYKEYRRKKGLSATIDDLKKISVTEWSEIFKTLYWDKWKADLINNQSIANFLVDWVWASGKYGIELPQKILGVKIDGVVGNITIGKINGEPQEELFNKLVAERKAFIDRICKSRPTNEKFRKGWLNRINDFKF